GFLVGDIGLEGLRIGGGAGTTQTTPTTPTNTTGGQTTQGGVVSSSGSGSSNRTCEAVESVRAKLQSSGGICRGATCTVLNGCNYQQYNSIIEKYTGSDTESDIELKKMIIVTMCKESSARRDAQNRNSNGTYDCGLMQINQANGCDGIIMTPDENIRRGVEIMKQKKSLATQTYSNVPALAGVFASYNCCANGTVPNAQSADCNASSGFPNPIPKWACPINPGDSAYNMCSVKDYACGLVACMNAL
ncbi:MAG: hypothetical protein RLZZ308_355, partial [Candidatus Parcubacteria bacterium]